MAPHDPWCAREEAALALAPMPPDPTRISMKATASIFILRLLMLISQKSLRHLLDTITFKEDSLFSVCLTEPIINTITNTNTNTTSNNNNTIPWRGFLLLLFSKFFFYKNLFPAVDCGLCLLLMFSCFSAAAAAGMVPLHCTSPDNNRPFQALFPLSDFILNPCPQFIKTKTRKRHSKISILRIFFYLTQVHSLPCLVTMCFC